jgi:50S ribosomal protein uL3
MLTGKNFFNLKNIFKSSCKEIFKNSLFNAQAYNILQVNRVMEKLTKERRESIAKRNQEIINELEGNPNEPIEEENSDQRKSWLKRIQEDKSHEEMMDRFKKTVAALDVPGGPLSKENYDKHKNDFDEKIWKKIAYNKPEKKKVIYRNMELEVNANFKIDKVQPYGKEILRTGVIGYKMGMTGVWDKYGIYYPLTVIKVDRCQVVQIKTKDKEGYYAIQLGIGEKRLKKTTKSLTGHFVKANVPPKKNIKEFKVSPENLLPLGYMIGAKHFVAGQYVDVRAKSKGKGTQGVMQRWNFSGGFASHGCSLKHRAPVKYI